MEATINNKSTSTGIKPDFQRVIRCMLNEYDGPINIIYRGVRKFVHILIFLRNHKTYKKWATIDYLAFYRRDKGYVHVKVFLRKPKNLYPVKQLSHGIILPTMLYVQPAKAQTRLCTHKYVPRIADWHHKACRVMTNCERESIPSSNK